MYVAEVVIAKLAEMRRGRKKPDPEQCDHDYESVYEGWDSETYQCKKCGDRYKLYDDEMR